LLAVQLINKAYIYSGVVARSLDAVSGDQGADGLTLFNDMLAEKSMTGDLVPYYGKIVVPTVDGQTEYFVQNLIDISTLTFNLNTVRFATGLRKRQAFFGSSRADNIKSLPYTYFWERSNGGAKIYLYFIPNQNYPLTITGKFFLDSVTNDTDLDLTLDRYYQLYLTYCLADYICTWNKVTPNQNVLKKIGEFEDNLFNMNSVDYSWTKVHTLSDSPDFINYAQAAIGKAWVP